MKTLVLALAVAALPALSSASAAPLPAVQIPSIGCPTGGQEIDPAPPDTVKSVHLDPRLAARLSLYGNVAFGPRGWHCQQYVSDDGYLTFVTPKVMRIKPDAIRGPVIMVFRLDSGFFGRFYAANIIAAYFPKRWDYTRKVMAEAVFPRSYFVFHPYRHDRFLARSDTMFEVETPPHTRGFGTDQFALDGLAMCSRVYFLDGEEPGFLITQVKLPAQMKGLLSAILDAVHP